MRSIKAFHCQSLNHSTIHDLREFSSRTCRIDKVVPPTCIGPFVAVLQKMITLHKDAHFMDICCIYSLFIHARNCNIKVLLLTDYNRPKPTKLLSPASTDCMSIRIFLASLPPIVVMVFPSTFITSATCSLLNNREVLLWI